MRDKLISLVSECLRDLREDMGQSPDGIDLETRLMGAKSGIDSVGLVTLITDVEERLADVFGVDLVLADENAMSRARSPFRRVGTLVEYIDEKLKEEGVSEAL